jgi:hypothetical protein
MERRAMSRRKTSSSSYPAPARTQQVAHHRAIWYSSFHNGGPLTRERSDRNPKFLTAGFKVKSKKGILKISYLVKQGLWGVIELSRMRQLSLDPA